ncbi:hypothetical protein [Aquimarina sp. AU474]|uniref:hypothetical protein n=1 Tax=Aquimarina sp. AU474 TaxID=2108529 RepID=UPI001358C38C|nr:hypothetical protein [Aquimarina sp. AU474]
MNYKKYSILLSILILVISCHTIKVNKSAMHTAITSPIALGVIGIQYDRVLHSDFKETTIPSYKKGIRVDVATETFNASTYKAYLQSSQNNKQGITYIDSNKTKPMFIKLDLIDRVTILSELKDRANDQTVQYLKNQKNAGIVTSVSIGLSEPVIQEILNAEAVFLINKQYKQYQLSLVKNGASYKTIDFASTTVFGYQLSYFCWGMDDKRKIVLSDIVEEASSCPKNTYRDARKAKEKMDYFKL